MSERLEIRISEKKKDLFKEASDLLGITVTKFIINLCTKEAKKIVGNYELIKHCSDRQLDMFGDKYE